MTQQPMLSQESTEPRDERPENLDDLMDEIGTKQADKLRLEQELAATSGELSRLSNKIIPLLIKKIPTDIENLKTRMIALGAVERGHILELSLPDANKIELHLNNNRYCVSDLKRNRHIGLFSGSKPAVIRIYGIDTISAIIINDDGTFRKEMPTDNSIEEGLVEYPKILAWFREQLTNMEEAKRAKELSGEIKEGE